MKGTSKTLDLCDQHLKKNCQLNVITDRQSRLLYTSLTCRVDETKFPCILPTILKSIRTSIWSSKTKSQIPQLIQKYHKTNS